MTEEHGGGCGAPMHNAPVEANVIGRSSADSECSELTVDSDAPGPDPLLGFAA
jgi:hypothetical protein